MTESNTRDTDNQDSLKHGKDIESEYSYLDYLIEKKFFKKFWRILAGFLTFFGVLGAIMAFLGIREYRDLAGTLEEAQTANRRLQKVYGDFVREDSIRAIREENSKYYSYFLQLSDETFIREAIMKKFEVYGFGFADSRIEAALSDYLYQQMHYITNPAADWLVKQHKSDSEHVAIGVLYRGVAGPLMARIDSIFYEVYPDAIIEHFEETRIPKQGFLYLIR